MARDNILYDVLQVWPNISADELKKHYRILAVKLCYEQVNLFLLNLIKN
jgi:DnaJ-class molecular chaperone